MKIRTYVIWYGIAAALVAFAFYGSGTGKTHVSDLVEIESEGCSETRYLANGRFELVPCYSQRSTCRTDSECEAATGERY